MNLTARLAARRNLAIGFLALVALFFFLPGFSSLPPTDRDEARFAQASRQMRESGDLVDIRFQSEPRYKKPIGIYWLQAGAASLIGRPLDTIWPYRLPSLLAAILALAFVYRLGERLFDRRVGLVGALLLAATLLLAVEARLAKTDAALLAATLGSVEALAAVYIGRWRRWTWLQFWVAASLGVLIKGPILPLILAATVVTLAIADRRWRWLAPLKPLWGIALMIVMVAPWLIAIGLQSQGAFFSQSLGHDFGAKLLGGEESHGAPPGYYLLMLAVTFWPSGLLAAAAAPAVWLRRRQPAFRFLLAWLLPAWLLMELIPTKLPHYVLPLYPALALLAAAVFSDMTRPVGAGWPRWLKAVGVGIWLGVGLILPAGIMVLEWHLEQHFDPVALATTVLVGLALLASLALLRRDRRDPALAALLAASLALQAGGFGLMLPRFDAIWISRQVQQLVAAKTPCPQPVVAATGYQEPSLVFLLGTATRFGGPRDSARFLLESRGHACALALIADEADGFFRASLPGSTPVVLGTVEGVNYSNGKRLELTLYALR
jgi:4-amino-4-deoxy-L-arabinose transferase-like glycosyltransferase